MSVHPHGISRLPLDGFSWILIFEDFSKICCDYLRLVWMWQEKWLLHVKQMRTQRACLSPNLQCTFFVLQQTVQCVHFVDILMSSVTKRNINKHTVCRKVLPTSASPRPHPAVRLSLCRRTSVINGNWHWITYVTYWRCRFSFKVHLEPE